MITFVSINRGYGGAEKLFDRLYSDFYLNNIDKSQLRYVRHDSIGLFSIRAIISLICIRRNTVVLNMSVLGIGVLYLIILKLLGNVIILYPHVVVSANKSRPKFWILRYIFQRVSVRLANYVAAISDGNYNELIKFTPSCKLHTVYNYVDCENNISFKLKDLNKEVAIIGRLQDLHKQQLTFIRNHKQLILTHNLKIHLFGSGPDEAAIREVVELNGLNNNIIFHGWLTENEIYSYDFSFVLNISRWEGLPLSVMESIYHDRILLASNIDGNRELVAPEYLFNNQEELNNLLISAVIEQKISLDVLVTQKKLLYSRCNKQRSLESFNSLVCTR